MGTRGQAGGVPPRRLPKGQLTEFSFSVGTDSDGTTGPVSLTPILHAAGDGDRKLTAEEEEARRIAEMGKPVLGENRRLEVIIEESYDFKVTFWGPQLPGVLGKVW